MKVKTDADLAGFDGKPIFHFDQTKNEITEERWTFRGATCHALLALDPKLSGEDKVKRFLLAQRISAQSEVEITLAESVLLQELVTKGFGVNITGSVWTMLEAAASAVPPEPVAPAPAAEVFDKDAVAA